jgi:hypothetical protein
MTTRKLPSFKWLAIKDEKVKRITIFIIFFMFPLTSALAQIVIPYGKPEVTSLSLPKLTSDYAGDAVVTVKNNGKEVGDFVVSLTCNRVDVLTPIQIVSVNSGSTTSLTFRIVGSTNQRYTTYTCTATEKDSVTQQSHSLTASGILEARPLCNRGEQICRQEGGIWKIYECNGYDFTILRQACGVEEVCERDRTGNYVCKRKRECAWDIVCHLNKLGFLYCFSCFNFNSLEVRF